MPTPPPKCVDCFSIKTNQVVIFAFSFMDSCCFRIREKLLLAILCSDFRCCTCPKLHHLTAWIVRNFLSWLLQPSLLCVSLTRRTWWITGGSHLARYFVTSLLFPLPTPHQQTHTRTRKKVLLSSVDGQPTQLGAGSEVWNYFTIVTFGNEHKTRYVVM